MKKMMRKMRENKGFTLAELLIVVAIIAVLVAISIPVFTTQLEKSRDGVSIANIRAAYAEAQTAYLTGSGDTNITYNITNGAGTITVANVAIKSQKGNSWSDLGGELPFVGGTGQMTSSAFNALDTGANAVKSAAFTFNADGVITGFALN